MCPAAITVPQKAQAEHKELPLRSSLNSVTMTVRGLAAALNSSGRYTYKVRLYLCDHVGRHKLTAAFHC